MNWVRTSIGGLGRVVTGKTPPTKNREFYDGVYPFVTPTDLDWQSYVVHETHSTVTELARDRNRNQFIPADAIMFTCIGNTIGKCGISAGDCLTNQQINSVIPNGDHDPRFVYYLLNFNRPQIRSIGIGNGAAQPIINKSTFSGVQVLIPQSRDNERRIAAILSAYDDLIDNNRRRVALLEGTARQLYKEWFVRFRFPSHEHVKVIDGVPEGWERVTFGEIAVVKKGKNITKDTVAKGDVPVVAGGLFPAYFHNTPNVLGSAVTISASGANAGYVNLYQRDIWASDCSYVAQGENPNLRYLYLMLKHRQDDLTAMQKGAAQPHVYPKDVERLVVLNVPNGLIEQFGAWVDPVFDQIAILQKQNHQLTQARDLLLPKLMNGTLTV